MTTDEDASQPAGLAAAAAELYGIDPSDFIARRTELVKKAKADKDKVLAAAITALRRPTVSAWYVNLAARARVASLLDLLRLGREMRDAQAKLDLLAVQSMTGRRRELERSVLVELQELLAARSITPTAGALAEVSSTLVAAVADPKAEDAVASGCLARSLVYAGFGEVDMSDALGAAIRLQLDEPLGERPRFTVLQGGRTDDSHERGVEETENPNDADTAQPDAQARAAQAQERIVAEHRKHAERALERAQRVRERAARTHERAAAAASDAAVKVERLEAELAVARAVLSDALSDQQDAADDLAVADEAVSRAESDLEAL